MEIGHTASTFIASAHDRSWPIGEESYGEPHGSVIWGAPDSREPGRHASTEADFDP